MFTIVPTTIKFHSTVGLITNSSSVVYTYQDSVKEAKELINAFLKTFNINKTADDIFCFGVFHEVDFYAEKIDATDADVTRVIESVLKGEIQAPKWLNEHGESSRYLWLISKEPEYNLLAEKMKSFLNSPDHEASYDG